MDTAPTIEIFRPGTFTAVDGQVVNFTAEDLASIAASYDAENEPAPLVIGHPQLDAPAMGWVDKVAMQGDRLVATPTDVEPAFAEAVRAKRFRRVSASLYPPGHAQNPKPEGWYLKHVGFLGAAAPSVRGLKPVAFSEAQQAASVTFDLDPTAKESAMTTANPKNPTPQSPEVVLALDFAERERVLADREAKLTTRETGVADRERKAENDRLAAVHAGSVSFAEALVKDGKLAPAGKDIVIGLLDTLEVAAVASFGEAGELAPAAAFKKLFDGAQPIVSFSEHARREDADAAKAALAFGAPSGLSVDQAALEHHNRAVALQAKEPNLSYMDAIRRTAA